MPSTSSPLSLPGMGRNGARCSSSARRSRRSGPCGPEHRRPVRAAVDDELADRRGQAVDVADGDAREDLTVGLAGDPGQPPEGLLAAVLGLDPRARAGCATRPPTGRHRCGRGPRCRPPPSVSSPGELARSRPAGSWSARRTGGAHPGRRRPAARSSPSRHRRPTAPAVAAHRGEVGVGLGRACVVPEAERDRSFHRHAASVAPGTRFGPVRCPARREHAALDGGHEGGVVASRSGRRSARANRLNASVGLVAAADVPGDHRRAAGPGVALGEQDTRRCRRSRPAHRRRCPRRRSRPSCRGTAARSTGARRPWSSRAAGR